MKNWNQPKCQTIKDIKYYNSTENSASLLGYAVDIQKSLILILHKQLFKNKIALKVTL